MRIEDANLLIEWDSVCKSVIEGLRKIGHDIILTCPKEEQKNVEKEYLNTEDIKAGDTIAWETPFGKEKVLRTGIVVAIVPKGESAMKYTLRSTKKCYREFRDISKIDRVLITIPDKKGEIRYVCPDIRKIIANRRIDNAD